MKPLPIVLAVVLVASLVANGLLYSSLNSTKAQLASTSTQLASTTTQLSSASSKADSLTKELATAKSNLDEANSKGEALAGDLANVQAQLEKSRAESEKKIAAMQPLVDKARALPINLSSRRGFLGNGSVLRIENTTREALPLKVKCSNATLGTKTIGVIVPASRTIEIGKLEGWDFLQGDTAEISSAGFDSITKKF